MSSYKSAAVRRYLSRLAVLMVLYVILIFAAGWTFRHEPNLGWLAWPLAIAPALPVLGVFWAVMRLLIEEPDEYLRMLFVRQALIVTAFCLTVMTIWEFLQNYELVPQGNGGFGAAFFWFMGLGIGSLYNKLITGDCEAC